MRPSITLILQLLVLAALAVAPWFASSFYTELLTKIILFAIFAMSLDLLVGYTGLVSLGHAAYFGIAAYVVALMSPKYEAASFWLTLPAAVGISALAAFVVGLFVIRTKGIYFIMVTLAFAQMFYYLFHDTALGGGSDGIYLNVKPEANIGELKIIDLDNHLHFYYLILAVLVLSFLFLKQVLRSPFGHALMGIKSNEHRMKSIGYNVFYYKLAAFTLAGGIAGLAGYLYAILFGFVTPELMSWHQSGNVLLMVILGGMGNLVGALLGALAFVSMQEYFASLTKHWQLVMGCVIVFAVLFLPGGISALPKRLFNWLNNKRGQDK